MTHLEKSKLIELFKQMHKSLVEVNPEYGKDLDGSIIDINSVDFDNFKVNDLIDVFGIVNLTMKYMIFDSEACRREIFALQHQLFDSGGDENESGK